MACAIVTRSIGQTQPAVTSGFDVYRLSAVASMPVLGLTAGATPGMVCSGLLVMAE
ncbi:hypothetical protein ACFODZ_00510 [Marinicella sediminis]|uniref:Uncharacterized protein n=1 Tax=Marinicella sediminis TaxID=1792834 RepID=A0ABV7J3L8_9GAMM|nr:hypothetical protein [Marinicella sediminis]